MGWDQQWDGGLLLQDTHVLGTRVLKEWVHHCIVCHSELIKAALTEPKQLIVCVLVGIPCSEELNSLKLQLCSFVLQNDRDVTT